MPEKADSTSQHRAVSAATQWHMDAVGADVDMAQDAPDATLKRATTGRMRVVAPPTLSLPAIPKEMTQPQMPAILSPHLAKPDNQKLESHPTHPITVVTPKFRTPGPRATPLPPRPGAKQRNHRIAIAGTLVGFLVLLLTFVPIVHGAGVSAPQWLTQASSAEYPTATPVLYPQHPIASGVGSFVCTALPFARMVQQEQAADGLPHPWYVSVILGQWGVEHGWNIPDYTGYNWGNSSAIPGFPSVGGTNQPGSPGAFAYAYNPTQGAAIYETFTKMRFYVGVWQAYPNGPVAQAQAIGQSPWDAGHYQEGGGIPGQSILNAMNNFNLYRFDNPKAQC
jgi:hypothetical protein